MPTCGDCCLLVQNKAGAYICAGKLTQCLGDRITPETDAKTCIRFDPKEKKPDSKAGSPKQSKE